MSLAVRVGYLWKSFRQETTAHKFLPSLITSSVVAMMTVVMSVSFVALIFVDPISSLVGVGTSLMLLMAAILGIFMAIFSSYAGTIAIPQDRVAPIVALMASLVIHQMAGAAPAAIGLTVLASIASCTLIVGAVLFLLGTYKLGNIVRFTPYPVIGGFLAGSGWLLLTGSFRVASGQTFSFFNLREFFASGSLAAWIPCAAFGTIAYLGVRFSRHYMTLPVLVVGAALAFYAWVGFNHQALELARERGWILSVPPDAGVRQIHTFPSLMRADWGVVLSQCPSFIALLLTSIVSILLNTSALELEADEDIDLNRELCAAGMANVVGGFAGGMIGFQSLSLSSLAVGMGVKSRLVGLISAGVCLLLLGFGTEVLGYIPKFILGGILFYTGLAFLTEWVFDAYFRLIREDYFLVVLILAVVAMVGDLQGVGAGIIVAAVLFVLKYSTVNVISSMLSGDSHHSTVDRSPAESRLLNDRGGQIHIVRLKGFIFFGSADNLLNTIRARQADPDLPPLAYLILDFQQVSGLEHLRPRQHPEARAARAKNGVHHPGRVRAGRYSKQLSPRRPVQREARADSPFPRPRLQHRMVRRRNPQARGRRGARRAPEPAANPQRVSSLGDRHERSAQVPRDGRRSERIITSCCRAIPPTISSSSSPGACVSWSSSTTAA